MKKKNFTLIELIAVITIMAVLMTMIITISKPDREKRDISTIGQTLSLYNAKVMLLNSGEFYLITLDNRLVIKDHNGVILEDIELSKNVKFLNSGSSTRRHFKMYHGGECFTLKRDAVTGKMVAKAKSIKFTIGKYEGKINQFTSKFSYYH